MHALFPVAMPPVIPSTDGLFLRHSPPFSCAAILYADDADFFFTRVCAANPLTPRLQPSEESMW